MAVPHNEGKVSSLQERVNECEKLLLSHSEVLDIAKEICKSLSTSQSAVEEQLTVTMAALVKLLPDITSLKDEMAKLHCRLEALEEKSYTFVKLN
jgi:chromosome segregation ATPase